MTSVEQKIQHMIEVKCKQFTGPERDVCPQLFLTGAEFVYGLHQCLYDWLVALSIGCGLSLLSLAALAATWILLPKTRHFQNYIAMNQCVNATALIFCIMIETLFAPVSEAFKIVHQALNDGDTKLLTLGLKDARWRRDFNEASVVSYLMTFTYVHISLCCWTTAAAVMCYTRVVTVFTKDLPRKYLIVNAACYGLPALGFVLNATLRDASDGLESLLLTSIAFTAIFAVVNTCIYLSVVIALCRGKRPGADESVRVVTTALVIFVIFGLVFSVIWIVELVLLMVFINQDKPPTNGASLATQTESLQDGADAVNQLFPLYYAVFSLLSGHVIVLSLFLLIGRKETREQWLELFRKYRR